MLLMRSCYDAVDQLNFVPMDQFQKDFFLLRQTEWEKYLAENDCKQVRLRLVSGLYHTRNSYSASCAQGASKTWVWLIPTHCLQARVYGCLRI